MQQMALKEAETRLAELIEMAAVGEDVVITRDDGSGFKIIPFPHKKPYPEFGSAKGLIWAVQKRPFMLKILPRKLVPNLTPKRR